MNKKRSLMSNVISILIIGVFLIGCGRDDSFSEHREWYEALNINQTSGISVENYEESDDSVRLYLKADYKALNSLNNVIQNHNDYIQSNPGYFDGTSVYIMAVNASSGSYQNYEWYYSSPDVEESDISFDDMQNDGAIKYLRGDIYDFVNAYKECSVEYSVPVLVLTTQDPGFYLPEDYKFLEQFKSLKRLVLNYSGEYDADTLLNAINEYTTGLEVYEVIEGNELRKLQ